MILVKIGAVLACAGLLATVLGLTIWLIGWIMEDLI